MSRLLAMANIAYTSATPDLACRPFVVVGQGSSEVRCPYDGWYAITIT